LRSSEPVPMRTQLSNVLVLLLPFVLVGCRTPEKQANTTQSSTTPNDSLSKYSLEELRHALDERRNRTIYPHNGDTLHEISDRDLVDNVNRREKMIYPHDLRKDYYEFQDNADYLKDAQSVAALIKPEHYHLTADGVKLVYKSIGESETLCSDQIFFSQPEAAYCSGFVVGPDLLATAGHCVTSNWKSVRVVFGYRMIRDTSGIHLGSIRSQDVYSIKEVVAQHVDGDGEDYAILRTDKPINAEHPPLPRRVQGEIEIHEGVYTLGYPTGLPLKVADQASVRSVSPKGFFRADLDTFGGNSGSPVLNASTHIVEGILVRGSNDYRYVNEDKCYRALNCPTVNGCEGEDVTAVSALNEASTEKSAAVTQPTSAQIDKSLALAKRDPIVRQFSSGSVISGSRKSFSGVYTVMSDPAPEGYKIGKYSYSLSGDRVCNAYSTCSAQIEDGKVAFHFTLQGHDEWGGSGQALSTGTLVVTYVPETDH
jgi:V8-like Glu-specific endopeptidase